MQREQTSEASFNQHETGLAFAGLLSAMEALPEVPGEKSSEFIADLSTLHLWVHVQQTHARLSG